MKTKKLTLSAMFVAIGVLSSNLIYIPVGASKCFPVQHAINVICAVLLGPIYSIATAFCISLVRNLLGTGSIMAFPGSMVGALLAALMYTKFQKTIWAGIGEVIGTGIIGGLIAMVMAKLILGNEVAALFYVIPFIISSTGGAIIGLLILKSTELIRLSKKFD